MLRISSLTIALLFVGSSAAAQSPVKQADALNNQGRKAFAAKDYSRAAEAFRGAIALSDEGRFHFNLCYLHDKWGDSLSADADKLNQFKTAMQECKIVSEGQAKATKALQQKATALWFQVWKKYEKLPKPTPDTGNGGTTSDGNGGTTTDGDGGTTTDGNGGTTTDGNGGTTTDGDGGTTTDGNGGTTSDGNGGNTKPGGGTSSGGGAGGGVDPFKPPPNSGNLIEKTGYEYKWALGAEIGPIASSLGNKDIYSRGGVQVRGMFNLHLRGAIGAQGYLQFARMANADGDVDNPFALEVTDLGGALYLQQPLGTRKNLHITLLGGAHLSIWTPADIGVSTDEGIVTVGARLEAGLALLLDTKGQHALTATIGANLYAAPETSKVHDVVGDFIGRMAELDEPGATFGITVGYTHRFTTPFGSSPIFTLQ